MMDQEDNELIEIARTGIEAERFINSSVGKYLLHRAEIDCQEAITEMKTVDFTNAEAVRKIQDKLNTPDKVVSWIKEVISAGESAEFILKQKDAEENQF